MKESREVPESRMWLLARRSSRNGILSSKATGHHSSSHQAFCKPCNYQAFGEDLCIYKSSLQNDFQKSTFTPGHPWRRQENPRGILMVQRSMAPLLTKDTCLLACSYPGSSPLWSLWPRPRKHLHSQKMTSQQQC